VWARHRNWEGIFLHFGQEMRLVCWVVAAFALETLSSNCSPEDYEYMLAESNSIELDSLLGNSGDPRKGNFNFLTYSLGMLLDPCKGRSFDCCDGMYGDPEYVRSSVVRKAGWVWALSRLGKMPYRCQKPCIGHWSSLNESSDLHSLKFDRIDADEDYVWALNFEENKIFRRDLDGSTPWRLVSGEIHGITASGAHAIYGIDGDSLLRILACIKPCDGQWGHPIEVEGHPEEGTPWQGPFLPENETVESYVDINADATYLWLVVSDGRLFSRRVLLPKQPADLLWKDVLIEDSPYGQWVDVSPISPLGNVTHVASSSPTESVWILNADGIVLACTHPCLNKDWVAAPLPGNSQRLTSIDVDAEYVWGTTALGQTFRRPVALHDILEEWTSIPADQGPSPTSLQAWDTIPDGGFSAIVLSTVNEPFHTTETYTVAEFPEHCAFITDRTLCGVNIEQGCRWNNQLGKCEKLVASANSRVPDQAVHVEDPTCVLVEKISDAGKVQVLPGYAMVREREGAEIRIIRDDGCVEHGVRMSTSDLRPPCWDNNETVKGDKRCADAKGRWQNLCFAVGISSTNFIPRCGGGLRESPDCGSFIEIHAAYSKGFVINDARIPLEIKFTSGYNTMTVPTHFKNFTSNSESRVICFGDYVLLWVQRTAHGRRIVEAEKHFHVDSPPCDWNAAKNRYEPFSTVSLLPL